MSFIKYNPDITGNDFVKSLGLTDERFREFSTVITETIISTIDRATESTDGELNITTEELMINLITEVEDPQEAVIAGIMYERGSHLLKTIGLRIETIFMGKKLLKRFGGQESYNELKDRLSGIIDKSDYPDSIKDSFYKLLNA